MIRIEGREIDRDLLIGRYKGNHIYFSRKADGRPSVRSKVFMDLVLGRGYTCRELFERNYSDEEDGGPLEGHHIVHILLNQLRPKMRAMGMHLVVDSRGGEKTYRFAPDYVA